MAPSQRVGRAVSAVNATLAAGLVVVLAALALVVDPPAPPGIAEFAPKATKPITRAPLGQSGPSGEGASGSCAVGGVCGPSPRPSGSVALPSPLPTRSGGVASTKQCLEWPDGSVTQTWDPQSPPCIADWPERVKGNGGATSRGVSKTEIRVTVPWGYTFDEQQPLVDFFNTRFELYGRRLVLVPFDPQDGDPNTGVRDAPTQRADAEAAKSLRPFASLTYFSGQSKFFVDRVTAAGIVTAGAANHVPVGTQAEQERQAPFAWNYAPTSDDLLRATATMVCRQLAGRPAAHSLDYRTAKRTFAIVVPDQKHFAGPLDGLEHVQDTLAACGVPRPRIVEYEEPQSTTNPSPIISAMTRLKAEGITSLILWPLLRGAAAPGAPQRAASSANYHPEWIIAGPSVDDVAALSFGASSLEQLRSSFGIAMWNKIQPRTRSPYYRAYVEASGRDVPEAVSTNRDVYEPLYQALQLIASGVQMGGPNLTPQRVEDALQATVFPNPGAGASPAYQAHVGFADDHVMVDDYAAFWFNPAEPYDPATVDSNPFCYVQSGRRWNGHAWPSGPDPFRPGEACR